MQTFREYQQEKKRGDVNLHPGESIINHCFFSRIPGQLEGQSLKISKNSSNKKGPLRDS